MNRTQARGASGKVTVGVALWPGILLSVFVILGGLVGLFAHMAFYAYRHKGALQFGSADVVGRLVWQWTLAGFVIGLYFGIRLLASKIRRARR